MGYVTREFLTTQFTNFATRIATVFAKKADVPARVSDLTNDSGFVTGAVDNLVNYYTKDQTYTRTEITNLIAGIGTMTLQRVETLPTTEISTTTIYLVPKTDAGTSNIFTEYIYFDGAWEIIGETYANLNGYVTDDDLTAALAGYAKATDLASYVAADDVETNNIDFSTYFA